MRGRMDDDDRKSQDGRGVGASTPRTILVMALSVDDDDFHSRRRPPSLWCKAATLVNDSDEAWPLQAR